MTLAEMKESIKTELTLELSNEPMFNENILSVKIDDAIRAVKRTRRYPSSYTETMIDADMEKFYENVKDIARYDFNMIGVEGQSASTENGESRTYIDRNTLFRGIIPFAK